jgi:hypothetical protein
MQQYAEIKDAFGGHPSTDQRVTHRAPNRLRPTHSAGSIVGATSADGVTTG